MSKPRLLILDGSLSGTNTAPLLERMETAIGGRAEARTFRLRDERPSEKALIESDGFIFATGTYWDSWGSPLQSFLEKATVLEAGSAWLGKPAAVLVTMHSVGGKEVLSRLQGVLSTLGCSLPPMSGMVYSLAAQLALQAPDSGFHGDFWCLDDLETVAHNLIESATGGHAWKAWPIDSQDARRRWIF